jgi:hypothetical protein
MAAMKGGTEEQILTTYRETISALYGAQRGKAIAQPPGRFHPGTNPVSGVECRAACTAP